MKEELGYAVMDSAGRLSEDNWELRWPQRDAVFSKIFREDSQVTSVYLAITLPIMSSTWRIRPNGAPEEIVRRVAEDLRLPVLGEDDDAPVASHRGRVSWSEHLEKALLSLIYGYGFFEQVYATDEDGEEHLAKLAWRPPGTIADIKVARDGGLEFIRQSAPTEVPGGEPVDIPVGRLVAYIHRPYDTSWTGTSLLRSVYKNVVLRDRYLEYESIAIERNSLGIPDYELSDLPDAEERKKEKAAAFEMVKAIKSGRASGLVRTSGSKFAFRGVDGSTATPRTAIEYHDNQIARSVLAHFLNLGGKGGSYSLAETQSDLFNQNLTTTADWIAETATQHIVEDLVAVAFPEHKGLCPVITHDPIASAISPEALANLINSGAIRADDRLEADTRRRTSLPAADPSTARERAPDAQVTGAPGRPHEPEERNE
ncbi:phage portal protein family protein [Ancrocorticia populi]|uniref:phage portal protein family protein n=1 Tax=Ancrocorticia populi TaxID=2175228 RepID=UPI003F9DF210